MAFRNLGRLLQQGADDLSTDARMALPPVVVEGTGEEADVTPATVYPNDDPRSDLRAIPGGYPEGYGLDLRDPNAAVAPPAVARRPAPVSREELPPELAGVVANLGGVADRAQQAMEADVPRPGSMRGVASRAVESAAMGAATPGRKPLVPPNGAAIPPEVAEFAAKKAAPEARRSFGGADIERGLSSMTGNIHAGMDIATNMRTPGYGGAMAEDADRQDAAVAARSAEEKAAREFALKKLGLDRQYAQGETRNEMEREKMRLASQPKPEKPRDPLADEKTRAEIAKLKAETERARRRPVAKPVADGAPANLTPKQRQQVQEIRERHQNIKDQIADLRGMIKSHGTQEAFGPFNGIMEQKIASIATDMAKLVDPESVARESEVEGFKRMLFEPSFWMQDETAQGLLQSFESDVDRRLQNAYRVRGIDPSAAGGGSDAAPTAHPPPAPFPGAKRIRRADGKTGWWDGKSPLPAGVEVVNG